MTQADVHAGGVGAKFTDRRRTEPRVTCDRTIPMLVCSSGDPSHFIRVQATDCSMHGLGLLLPEHVEPGQQILARMEIDRQPTLLMYTVRYCIPMKTDQFRTGVRFSGYVAQTYRGELQSIVSALI